MQANWHHIAISVRDMDRAIRFYCDLLGFELVWDMDHRGSESLGYVVGLPHPDVRIAMLKGYGGRIELFQYDHPAGEDTGPKRQCDFGLTHFALSVRGIDGIYEALISQGVAFNCPPQDLRPGVRATYLKDPDNNTVELVQYDE